METKSLDLNSTQLKFSAEQGLKEGQFEGYLSVFNQVDDGGDMIMPGAYTKTLQNRKRPVHLKDNHSKDVVGIWLDLAPDDYGLYGKGEFTPGHSIAQDRYASMKHGAMTGLSIGYRVSPGGAKSVNGVRQLSDLVLIEGSVVYDPMEVDAQVSMVKSIQTDFSDLLTVRDFEGHMRDAYGLSKKGSARFIAQFKDVLRDEVTDTKAQQIAEAIKQLQLNPER